MKKILGSRITQIIVLVSITLGVYINSFNGDFVFDDKPMISGYDFIQDISNLPKVFTAPTSLYGNTNYYRPLQTISNMTDYFLWGKVPFGFHVTNFLFHILAVLLLYWLLQIIFKKKKLAFLTAIFFAVHPANTSVVSYISGRADSMLLCFMLLSFGFYIKESYLSFKPKFIPLSLIFFGMALLTKEYAVMIPLLFLIFDTYMVKFSELKRKNIDLTRYISYGIILAAYVIFRFTKMSFFVEGSIEPFPFINRIISVPYYLAQYFRLAVFPYDLHIGRLPWVADSLADLKVIFSIVTVGLFTTFVFIKKNKNREAWFGLCWFYLMILPALNVITPLFYTFADNWLYIPGIGLYLVICSLIVRFTEKGAKGLRYAAIIGYSMLIFFMSVLTYRQNFVWTDEISLGMNTLKYNPREFKVWNNLGVVYLGRRDLDKAEESFKKCLEIKPDTGMAYFNLYRVYMAKNNRSQALKYLAEARKYDPKRVGIIIEKMGIKD